MSGFKILDYIKEAKELEDLFIKFHSECTVTQGYGRFHEYIDYVVLSNSAKPIQRELLRRYETWFAVTKLIVRQHSDRTKIFEEKYEPIKGFILLSERMTKETLLNLFIRLFDEQVNILHALIPIIELNETNFKKVITADLLNSELEQAEVLYNSNFYQPAGAIAGVVLERYLKTLCEVNGIILEEKDTIDPLATKLYTSKKLPDFDVTLLKSIQHLASIRNKCVHPKEEVKPSEVRELIDKVKKITFLSL